MFYGKICYYITPAEKIQCLIVLSLFSCFRINKGLLFSCIFSYKMASEENKQCKNKGLSISRNSGISTTKIFRIESLALIADAKGISFSQNPLLKVVCDYNYIKSISGEATKCSTVWKFNKELKKHRPNKCCPRDSSSRFEKALYYSLPLTM